MKATEKPVTQSRRRRWRRPIIGLFICFLLMALLFGRATIHLALTYYRDSTERVTLPANVADDASRMSATEVREHWEIPADFDAATAQLRELLKRAREQRLPIAIAGSRHTMGGHTIAPDGIVINMLPFNQLRLDDSTLTLRAGGGARWAGIIEYLNPRGLSVGVMQSNNSFTVGGSLSANCHGWATGQPPIASTVRSFRLMKADGEIVTCSRQQNPELFSAVLGGYGLFGIILDADLAVVRNECLSPKCFVIASSQYAAMHTQHVQNGRDVNMSYGRLSIAPGENFLREAILTVLHRLPDTAPPPLSEASYRTLRRTLVRGSAGSDYGKDLRWDVEKRTLDRFAAMTFARNQLLNEGVELYQDASAGSTDILHEYFVPGERFEDFLVLLRRIMPEHRGDLLNVTVRDVRRDEDSFLRYADRDMFGLVMLFSQARTADAEAQMERMTQALIDAALACGGRYYLPYRLHATKEQFARAYPQGRVFFELKRKYDPGELFQNKFYQKYGRQ